MKAQITPGGMLVVSAESATEAYALKQFAKNSTVVVAAESGRPFASVADLREFWRMDLLALDSNWPRTGGPS